MDLKYKVMTGEMDLVELGGKKSLNCVHFPSPQHALACAHTHKQKKSTEGFKKQTSGGCTIRILVLLVEFHKYNSIAYTPGSLD